MATSHGIELRFDTKLGDEYQHFLKHAQVSCEFKFPVQLVANFFIFFKFAGIKVHVYVSLGKLDSRLLCNTRGASRLAIRYYIFIRILELTLQGQPGSNEMVQL